VSATCGTNNETTNESSQTRLQGPQTFKGDWCQLGELRRFSVGDISDKVRGTLLATFDGDELGVPLEMRKG
jgi:hypothetical protein